MVNIYTLNSPSITIKSDLAAQSPLYIYLNDNSTKLLYSISIRELLEHPEVKTPLKIRDESISFLLQSGIVPLPHTVYENIFSLGIGDELKIGTIRGKIELTFTHNFPFKNENRDKKSSLDEDTILELLANATTSKLQEGLPNYLFHSAGKDSNMIALSLAKAGYQKRIKCVTHQSSGEDDESKISKKIAQKLGFEHQTLYLPKKLEKNHIESINNYFENTPLPCVDNVTLAYPLYTTQIEFNHANIIDGSGNDVYLGHIPDKSEYTKQRLFSKFHYLRAFTDRLDSSNKLRNITSTRSEWAGVSGFSFGDTQKIFQNASNVYSYWKNADKQRANWDYFDLRADTWGCMVESDRVMRKSRNLAELTQSNLILPWCDSSVAEYFSKLPETYLFERKTLKNKLILRKILKERIDLDSDHLGKMAFTFDYFSILEMMKEDVHNEIIECKLWNKKGIDNLFKQLYRNRKTNFKNRVLLQRLYLISAWYNKNRYIKRGE